eukprot:SAG11_NODE_2987_length_2788_cov_8.292674_1_plen_517_part_00
MDPVAQLVEFCRAAGTAVIDSEEEEARALATFSRLASAAAVVSPEAQRMLRATLKWHGETKGFLAGHSVLPGDLYQLAAQLSGKKDQPHISASEREEAVERIRRCDRHLRKCLNMEISEELLLRQAKTRESQIYQEVTRENGGSNKERDAYLVKLEDHCKKLQQLVQAHEDTTPRSRGQPGSVTQSVLVGGVGVVPQWNQSPKGEGDAMPLQRLTSADAPPPSEPPPGFSDTMPPQPSQPPPDHSSESLLDYDQAPDDRNLSAAKNSLVRGKSMAAAHKNTLMIGGGMPQIEYVPKAGGPYQRPRTDQSATELQAAEQTATYWRKLESLRKHKPFAMRYIQTLDKFMERTQEEILAATDEDAKNQLSKKKKVAENVRKYLFLLCRLCNENPDKGVSFKPNLRMLEVIEKTLKAVYKRQKMPDARASWESTAASNKSSRRSHKNTYDVAGLRGSHPNPNVKPLPYNMHELSWNTDTTRNAEEKYCYCGTNKQVPCVQCKVCKRDRRRERHIKAMKRK